MPKSWPCGPTGSTVLTGCATWPAENRRSASAINSMMSSSGSRRAMSASRRSRKKTRAPRALLTSEASSTLSDVGWLSGSCDRRRSAQPATHSSQITASVPSTRSASSGGFPPQKEHRKSSKSSASAPLIFRRLMTTTSPFLFRRVNTVVRPTDPMRSAAETATNNLGGAESGAKLYRISAS
jgi:hypothetical protein